MVHPHPTVSRGVGERPIDIRFYAPAAGPTEAVAYSVVLLQTQCEPGRKYGPPNWRHPNRRTSAHVSATDP
jgi:hypothetical protein